ncbi:MAG: hypothetical protein ACKOGP_07525 [Bacteroidota bacterium]
MEYFDIQLLCMEGGVGSPIEIGQAQGGAATATGTATGTATNPLSFFF